MSIGKKNDIQEIIEKSGDNSILIPSVKQTPVYRGGFRGSIEINMNRQLYIFG